MSLSVRDKGEREDTQHFVHELELQSYGNLAGQFAGIDGPRTGNPAEVALKVLVNLPFPE
jgi:hypothetical protein